MTRDEAEAKVDEIIADLAAGEETPPADETLAAVLFDLARQEHGELLRALRRRAADLNPFVLLD